MPRIARVAIPGRPCGDEAFVRKIEPQTGRNFSPNKPGPRPKNRQKRQR